MDYQLPTYLPGTVQLTGGDPRMLKGLPHCLEDCHLAEIHKLGKLLGDSEEVAVIATHCQPRLHQEEEAHMEYVTPPLPITYSMMTIGPNQGGQGRDGTN